MGYFLQINSLIGCPYSIQVEELIKNTNIPHNITKISFEDKNKFKNENIQTFPQIYLKKDNSQGQLLLGGNSDFMEIYNNRKKNLNIQMDILNNKYPDFGKKTKLRIIELLNY